MRAFQDHRGEIGNHIGRAHSNATLQTLDGGRPRATRIARFEVVARRGDLDSRGFTVELRRESLPRRFARRPTRTKVPRITCHTE
jgi:hypothetical protein